MQRIVVVMLAALVFIGPTFSASAASDEEKCLSGRAKATGKYQACVQKALRKRYGGGSGGDEGPGFQSRLSKCRVKYDVTHVKLQKFSGTTCDAPRWVDNGLTVTDNLTGLIWEKKTEDGSVHDVGNTYDWTASDGDFTDEDGTAFTVFLESLNAGTGFDGANGWRLPSFAELQTILLPEVHPCSSSPCIDESVFGPSPASFFWSATSSAQSSGLAWYVSFSNSDVFSGSKVQGNRTVRAVRGGW